MSSTDIAKRNRANAARGARYETDCVKFLREDHHMRVERTRNSGVQDQGDLVIQVGLDDYVAECKDRARFDPQAWLREAIAEAENYRAKRGLPVDKVHPAVFFKVRGKNARESIVLLPVAEYVRLVDAASHAPTH